MDLTVYFCSNEGLSAQDVREMYKVNEDWGGNEELLEGYQYKFLRNFSPRPSYLKWPFGLVNFGIIKEIIQNRPDSVILMSWMNPTWWMALAICAIFRIPFFYMTDANVQIEPLRSNLKRRIKRILLGRVVFKLSSGFLCAGTANDSFYKMYGVNEKKLFPFAYSWGYAPLFKKSEQLKPLRSRLREYFDIPEKNLVILYCGRLSREKNLFNLVGAYHRLDHDRKSLVFAGDGDLRQALQQYAGDLGASSVYFPGFQNRDQIAKYYAVSDVLVLPSVRETWGMVVNEAMCFGLAVVVSHQVGAGVDLVVDGQNGFVVATDEDAILRGIQRYSDLSEDERILMGKRSIEIMEEWTNRDLAEQLVQNVESVKNSRGH